MEPTLNRPKPWMLPFWFMLGIMIVNMLEELFVLHALVKVVTIYSSKYVLLILVWPAILLVEAIIYWRIRKRIHERKWVWAHLLFSLFAFVLVWVLYFGVGVILLYSDRDMLTRNRGLLNNIKFYCYWAAIIIGHIFFIVAIVRSLSCKNAVASQEANDFLNEL